MMKPVTILLTLLVSAALGVALAQQSEIEALNQAWVSSFNQGDAPGVAALYAQFGEVQPLNGFPLFGEEGVLRFVTTMQEAGAASVQMVILSAHLANDFGQYLVEYTFEDAAGQTLDWGHAEFLLHQEEGAWKIWQHRHLGLFPPPGFGLGN